MATEELDERAVALIEDLTEHDVVLQSWRGATSGTVKFTIDGHDAIPASLMHVLADHDVTLGKGDNWIAVC